VTLIGKANCENTIPVFARTTPPLQSSPALLHIAVPVREARVRLDDDAREDAVGNIANR
jgi:hypothetical protein